MVLPADFAAKISLLTSTGKQVAIEAGRTAVDGAARPHNRTDREGRLSTHTGSSLRLPSTAGLGSLAAVQIAAGERVKSTQSCRSRILGLCLFLMMLAVAPRKDSVQLG